MNNKPVAKGSIKVTDIDKSLMVQGAKGTYLGIVIWENKDGEDRFGNTHVVMQDVSKEQREQGIKGRIIGNIKMWPTGGQQARQAPGPTQNVRSPQGVPADDDCPF